MIFLKYQECFLDLYTQNLWYNTNLLEVRKNNVVTMFFVSAEDYDLIPR